MKVPDQRGHFGPYGGRYVPETVIPALEGLAKAYRAARRDRSFRRELQHHLRNYAGRPHPAHLRDPHDRRSRGKRPDLPQARGPLSHRRAQDQQHPRPGAAGPAHGQARIIAETGAGQHGVATATACAPFGWSARSTWARRTSSARP